MLYEKSGTSTRNMQKVFPPKLRRGDEVRIVAPSRSLAVVGDKARKTASDRFAKLGLKLSFGGHVNEVDEFNSGSIESRFSSH